MAARTEKTKAKRDADNVTSGTAKPTENDASPGSEASPSELPSDPDESEEDDEEEEEAPAPPPKPEEQEPRKTTTSEAPSLFARFARFWATDLDGN